MPLRSRRRASLAAWALFLSAALAGLPPDAAAQDKPAGPPLGVQVEPPFDDLAEPGWIPVAVTLTNTGEAEIAGRLRAHARLMDFDLSRAEREIHLPAHARHQVHLYLYLPKVNTSSGELEVEFVRTGSRRPDYSARIPLRYEIATNLLVLGTNPAPLLALDRRSQPNTGLPAQPTRWRILRGSPSSLPDRWIGYDRIDFVVLNDISPSTQLGLEQQAALLDWVRGGGTLLVSPGPDPLRLQDPFYQALIPGLEVQSETVSGLKELGERVGVPLDPGRPFVVHRPKRGDVVLAGIEAGTIARFRLGFGTVLFTCFDLGRPPLAGWAGNQKLWPDLLGPFVSRNPHKVEYGDVGNMTFQAQQQQEDPLLEVLGKGLSRLPSMALLLVVILLYLAAIGPLNYLVLRRYNLHLYTILSVPAIALVFVLLIIGLGYLTNGASTLLQRAAVVSALSGEPFVHHRAYLCLFSASPRGYDLGFDERSAPHPLFSSAEAATTSGIDLEQTRALTVKDFPLKLWEQGYFAGDALRPLEKPLRASARDGRFALTNTLEVPIREGAFVNAAAEVVVATVGRVEPGASVAGTPCQAVNASPLAIAPRTATDVDRFVGAFLAYAVKQVHEAAQGEKVTGRPTVFIGLLDRDLAESRVNAGWLRKGDEALVLCVWCEP